MLCTSQMLHTFAIGVQVDCRGSADLYVGPSTSLLAQHSAVVVSTSQNCSLYYRSYSNSWVRPCADTNLKVLHVIANKRV